MVTLNTTWKKVRSLIGVKKESLQIFRNLKAFDMYQRRESNPHIRGYTILSRARLPVPPLWLVFARALLAGFTT